MLRATVVTTATRLIPRRVRARELRCGNGNRDLAGERESHGERCKKEDRAAPSRVLVRITRKAKDSAQRRNVSFCWAGGTGAPITAGFCASPEQAAEPAVHCVWYIDASERGFVLGARQCGGNAWEPPTQAKGDRPITSFAISRVAGGRVRTRQDRRPVRVAAWRKQSGRRSGKRHTCGREPKAIEGFFRTLGQEPYCASPFGLRGIMGFRVGLFGASSLSSCF